MKKNLLMNLSILTLTYSCATYELSKKEICIYSEEKLRLVCKDSRNEIGKQHYERELQESDIVTNYRDYLTRQREISDILYKLRTGKK